ncbi:MAG: cell division protein ZapA [Rhodoferax sp.]|nr:cell division protein ZapA [Rhodoferax sp.]MDP3652944.1 cell division protein ZapA [Rhodoferax sp.]
MKQLEVQIMGQSYLLGCPQGGEARLLEAVERVDTAMCKIRDAGKVRARERIAVLAALNLAFDLSDQQQAPPPTVAEVAAPGSAGATPWVGGAHSPQHAGDADLLLTSLLERLDAALGEDGRLL